MSNKPYQPLTFTQHDRASLRGTSDLLTPNQIEALEDGAIVYVQWPDSEAVIPHRIRRREFKGYDRPWIYATDYNHYIETKCFWHCEISGYGQYKASQLKVWQHEEPAEPEAEYGEEIFITLEWSK